MKKIGLFILLIFTGFAISFAQSDDAKRDKRMKEVQEYKMKFLAQEMELNEAQKKKFFELYGEMSELKHQCYRTAMKLQHKVKHEKNATEQDYQQAAEALNKANAEWSETEKTYNDKFSEFLSQKQIFKMKEAENTFRIKLEEMKNNRKKEPKDKK